MTAMTLSFIRSRIQARTPQRFEAIEPVSLSLEVPVETEALRSGPYAKPTDVRALYRAASAAGGATVMASAD